MSNETVNLVKSVTAEVCKALRIGSGLRDDVQGICSLAVLTQLKNCKATGQKPLRRYLYLCAYQQTLRWLKGEQQHRAAELTSEPVAPESEAVDEGELRAALERLEPAERQIVWLRFWGGLTIDAIADKVNRPRSTVADHLNVIVSRLRGELGGDQGWGGSAGE